MTTHGIRAGGLLSVVMVLLLAACGPGSKEAVPLPSPASPTSPSPSSPDPSSMPTPFFVVGNKGLNGPRIVATGLDRLTITNNDVREHRFQVVRVDPPLTADRVAASVRAGTWPTQGARVLDAGKPMDPTRTDLIRVDPLQPGTYVIVDVATDPKTGKPYAVEPASVWVFEVIPPSP